jgi:hypothetical protein
LISLFLPGFIDFAAYSSLTEKHPMMLSQFTLNVATLATAEQPHNARAANED